jgi:membrane-associated phospholipid phosphatase
LLLAIGPVFHMITRRYVLLTVVATIILAIVDLIWLPHSNVRFLPANFVQLAKPAAMIIALYAVSRFTIFRLVYDQSKVAGVIRRAAEALARLASTFALMIPLMFVGCLFMFLATATQRPLMDHELASFDAVLGFNWLYVVELLNSSSAISMVLVACYHALGGLFLLSLFWHAIFSRFERSAELIGMIAVSSALTAALMAIVPSAGAYAYYSPPESLFSNYSGIGGLAHLKTLDVLRSGEPWDFLVTRSMGLVSFPSFHVALGIVLIYTFRRTLLLAVPVAIINSLMALATIPEGGHHLSDILAGAAIAALTILVVRVLDVAPQKTVYADPLVS